MRAGLVLDNQSNTIFAGDILRLHNGELAPGNAVFEMNGANSPAGDRAANRDTVQHVREFQIIDVLRASGDLLTPFFSLHRFSNRSVCLHRLSVALIRGFIALLLPGPKSF